MKRKGSSIIFYNGYNQVLLLLRDDNPAIPYPDMWDLPGGHVEPDESPDACIVREMLEEIELDVAGCTLFKIYEFSDRTEYVYMLETSITPDQVRLHEGQMLRWFSQSDLSGIPLAYGFDLVLSDFFAVRLITPAIKTTKLSHKGLLGD
jgi:8-oxo-dGTP diphosphatase